MARVAFLGPPVVSFLTFLVGRVPNPTKMKKVSALILTSLLEDLVLASWPALLHGKDVPAIGQRQLAGLFPVTFLGG